MWIRIQVTLLYTFKVFESERESRTNRKPPGMQLNEQLLIDVCIIYRPTRGPGLL